MGGFNIASEIINSEAGCTQPRVLTKNELFGQKAPPADEDKPKKKKKKKNKDKEGKEEDEEVEKEAKWCSQINKRLAE